MGNPVSKLQSEKKQNVSVLDESNEERDQFKLDPRSPSAEISRTPVQLRSPKKPTHQKVTKQQNLNESLSTPTKTKGMLNSLLRGRLGPNFDLRSPSANIDRTPIVLDKKVDSDSKITLEGITDSFTNLTLKPKILLRDDSELDGSLVNTDGEDKELDEIAEDADDYMKTNNDKEISSVLSGNCDKRKSYLETNVDCLETDLDKVKTLPKLRKANLNTPSFISGSNMGTLDPRSPSGDFCRTPIVQSEIQKTPVCDNKLMIVNELGDPRSVSKDIIRTPIVLPVNRNVTMTPLINPEDLNKSPGDENILNLSVELPNESKLVMKTTKLDEIRQEFAKKYSKNIKSDPVNQIYQDTEFHKVTPRKALSASKRTPLSCVANKERLHPRSKSENGTIKKVEAELTTVNDLKTVRTPLSCLRNRQTKSENTSQVKKMESLTLVNDLSHSGIPKPPASSVKSLRGLSKIPTFHQKTVNTPATDNFGAEIENTQISSKPDTWDKDTSVVI